MIIDPLWIETANAHSLSKVFRPRMSTSLLVSDTLCTEINTPVPIAQPTPPQPSDDRVSEIVDEAVSAGSERE